MKYLIPALILCASQAVAAPQIEFTADELREIDNASSEIKVQGERYPEQLQKLVGR